MCSIMGFSKKTRSREEILPYFARTRSRGPDMSRIVETPSGYLCFHRLAIMGLTDEDEHLSGEVLWEGRDLLKMSKKEWFGLRGTDIAMVYQDALSSLNPSMLISAQMKQRQIRRTYLALTDGIPPERGTISAPVARMDASVITREVNFERGEAAVTHYERLAVSNGYALVELHLDTGRTHQIRVHMKYIGCPLPGDFLYHPVFDRIGRQALHSFQLEFAHPITGEPMCFLAPVPEDFRRAFLQ